VDGFLGLNLIFIISCIIFIYKLLTNDSYIISIEHIKDRIAIRTKNLAMKYPIISLVIVILSCTLLNAQQSGWSIQSSTTGQNLKGIVYRHEYAMLVSECGLAVVFYPAWLM
jgi:hypothetical protein